MATKQKQASQAEKIGKFLHAYMEKHNHPASPDFVDTLTEMIVEDDLLPGDAEEAKRFMAGLITNAEEFTVDGARDVLDRAMGAAIEDEPAILEQLRELKPFEPDEQAITGDAARLALKLVRAADKMPRIPKGKTNTQFNYKYAGVDTIVEIIRTVLASEGIAFTAAIEDSTSFVAYKSKNGSEMYRTLVRLRYTFIDAENGATISLPWIGEADDAQDKGVSKASRSGTKYFLINTFLLPTGEPEADGS